MNEELKWRKSSFSSGAENCVEVSEDGNGGRYVRDTKDRTKAAHHYTAGEWDAFIKGVKAGEFD